MKKEKAYLQCECEYEMKRNIIQIAHRRNVSMSDVMREALREYIVEHLNKGETK